MDFTTLDSNEFDFFTARSIPFSE